MPTKCQCEHAAHLEEDQRTPCGNPGHKYGAGFRRRRQRPDALRHLQGL